MEKKTIVLVDLSGIFWAAWHAAAGSSIDTAYQWTVSRVRRIVSGHDHVAICCDSGRSFRKDIAESYKAQRPPKDEAAMAQLRRTQESLEADGMHVLVAKGFEADDIIATATAWAVGEGLSVVIASNDKDMLQLIDESVAVLKPQNDAVWTVAEVVSNLKIRPAQMRDFLALCGDKSDNIQGIPGVGPTHAARLLNEFGSIRGIYASIDKVDDDGAPLVKPPGLRKALQENVVALDLAVKLVSLRKDVPIDCAALLERKEIKRMNKVSEADFDEGSYEDEERAAMAEESPAQQPPVQLAPPIQEATAQAPTPSVAKASEKRVPFVEARQPAPLALTTADPSWQLALEPNSLGAAMRLAEALFESRLFGQWSNPSAIFSIIVAGRSMGLDAATALRGMFCLEGRVGLYAQLMAGLVLKSGKAEFLECVKTTSEVCVYETKRVGGRSVQTCEFTIEDARRAGLVKEKSGWSKFPKSMLRARCTAEICRMVYPDICSNCYDPSEFEESSAA